MQFKEQKGRVQVLAYDGYDKEKRRAIVKMLGSFDRYDYSLSVGLLEKLTDEQKEELQSEIDRRRQSHDKAMRQGAILYSDSRIKEYADIVSSGEYDIPPEKADQIWEAMELLARSLKKAGFKKPLKTHSERVSGDQPELPLAEPLQSSEKTK
jgi:hypothetical protein